MWKKVLGVVLSLVVVGMLATPVDAAPPLPKKGDKITVSVWGITDLKVGHKITVTVFQTYPSCWSSKKTVEVNNLSHLLGPGYFAPNYYCVAFILPPGRYEVKAQASVSPWSVFFRYPEEDYFWIKSGELNVSWHIDMFSYKIN